MWVTLLCYNGLGEKRTPAGDWREMPRTPINAPEAISLGRLHRGTAPIITGLITPKHTIELPGLERYPLLTFQLPGSAG